MKIFSASALHSAIKRKAGRGGVAGFSPRGVLSEHGERNAG